MAVQPLAPTSAFQQTNTVITDNRPQTADRQRTLTADAVIHTGTIVTDGRHEQPIQADMTGLYNVGNRYMQQTYYIHTTQINIITYIHI